MIELFSRIVAVFILVLFSPLFIVVGLGSLFFQGMPIFFTQKRIGYNFNPFFLYKFRTMIKNVDQNKITFLGDQRITKWGKILRLFKLDELPQLWNVVNGEMRFIGPRPEVEEYVSYKKFTFLKKVKPGLSDFASIIFRDEEKILALLTGENPYLCTILPLKIQLAHLYASHKSFLLDLSLVILTISSIFLPSWSKNIIIQKNIHSLDQNLADKLRLVLRLK